MAKAKAKKKPTKAKGGGKRANGTLDLPVGFGNVNVGDKTARVGVTIDRGSLTLTRADESLCERRLTGQIIAKPAGWSADQAGLDGFDADTELTGTFDVKGINVTADHISAGLTFALSEIDVATLASFAKRAGRLVIESSEEIPEPEKLPDEVPEPEETPES